MQNNMQNNREIYNVVSHLDVKQVKIAKKASNLIEFCP